MQMPGLSGSVVAEIALLVRPALAPAGEQDRDSPLGNRTMGLLEGLDLLDRRGVIRIGRYCLAHVDDERLSDEAGGWDPVRGQAVLREMIRSVEMGPSVLAGAQAVRGVEIPPGGRPHSIVRQLEGARGRP